MKHFYTFFISLLFIVSCNDIKTDNTLQSLTEKIEHLNTYNKATFNSDYIALKRKAELDETLKSIYEIATALNDIADDYFKYLDSVKQQVRNFKPISGKQADVNSLQNKYFEKNKITKEGQKFKDKTENFKSRLKYLIEDEYPSTHILLDSLFNTKPIKVFNNKEEDWLYYQIVGVSNATTVANLTLMQSKIVTIESYLMSHIIGDSNLISNAFRVDIVLERSKYYPGDKVKGKLFISKSSEDIFPKDVVLNGNDIDEKYYQNGEVAIEFTAPKEVGEHPLEGELKVLQDNLDITLYFNKSFSVISKPKPKIVAVKKDNNIKSGIDAKSKTQVNKDDLGALSKPEISIRGKFVNSRGVIKITKNSFRLATIDIFIPDSDLEATVTEFSFKPSDQPTIKIYGNQLTVRAISILNKSRRGREFKIFNVKAKLKINTKYRLKTPNTVIIEIIN